MKLLLHEIINYTLTNYGRRYLYLLNTQLGWLFPSISPLTHHLPSNYQIYKPPHPTIHLLLACKIALCHPLFHNLVTINGIFGLLLLSAFILPIHSFTPTNPLKIRSDTPIKYSPNSVAVLSD